MRAKLEADAPRVVCAEHEVVVAAVPWARHDAGHTYAFDETVAWSAAQSSKSTATSFVAAAGVSPHVLVDPEHPDAVEPGGVVD